MGVMMAGFHYGVNVLQGINFVDYHAIGEKEAALKEKKDEKKKRHEEVRRKEVEAEPWRLDYRVLAAKEKLEALKDERRDANLKMEFDESTRLTKEVSKAERKYESAMEKAEKHYKKHGSVKTEKGEKQDKAEKTAE